jgi:putative oxidoreductase
MDAGLLIARTIVGLLFVGHGTQKLFGWWGGGGIDGTAGMFGQLGYRAPRKMAALAGFAETGGGALLAVGLATPLAAAMLIGVMVNAIVAVHLDKGLWVTKGGFEYPLMMSAIATALASTGPGRFSLDRVVGWYPSSRVAALFALGLGVASGLAILATRRPPAAAPQEQSEPIRRRRAA